jgi:hypothetical protein
MEDLLREAKSQQNKFEELVSKIPVYKGYKEKELRRETDKLLRNHVSDLAETQWRRIADLQRQLLSNGMLIYVDDLQATETRLRRFLDRVRHARYGYSGLFNVTKVDEDVLDAVYVFDAALVDKVQAIEKSLDSVQEAIDEGEGVPGAIREATEVVGTANETFDKREKILRGVE